MKLVKLLKLLQAVCGKFYTVGVDSNGIYAHTLSGSFISLPLPLGINVLADQPVCIHIDYLKQMAALTQCTIRYADETTNITVEIDSRDLAEPIKFESEFYPKIDKSRLFVKLDQQLDPALFDAKHSDFMCTDDARTNLHGVMVAPATPVMPDAHKVAFATNGHTLSALRCNSDYAQFSVSSELYEIINFFKNKNDKPVVFVSKNGDDIVFSVDGKQSYGNYIKVVQRADTQLTGPQLDKALPSPFDPDRKQATVVRKSALDAFKVAKDRGLDRSYVTLRVGIDNNDSYIEFGQKQAEVKVRIPIEASCENVEIPLKVNLSKSYLKSAVDAIDSATLIINFNCNTTEASPLYFLPTTNNNECFVVMPMRS